MFEPWSAIFTSQLSQVDETEISQGRITDVYRGYLSNNV